MSTENSKNAPRRGRGRPKKVKNLNSQQLAQQSVEQVRRGRGRPRKITDDQAVKPVQAEIVPAGTEIPKLKHPSEGITFVQAVELEKRYISQSDKFFEDRSNLNQLMDTSRNLSLNEKKRLTEELEKLEAAVKADEDKLSTFSKAEREAITNYVDEDRSLQALHLNHKADVELMTVETRAKEKILIDKRLQLKSVVTNKKLIRNQEVQVLEQIDKKGVDQALVKKLASLGLMKGKADSEITGLQIEVTDAQKELRESKEILRQCEALTAQYEAQIHYHKAIAGNNISLYKFTKTRAKGESAIANEADFYDALSLEEKLLFAKLGKPTRKNLVEGRYVCSNRNEIWVTDWFTRGKGSSAITVLLVTDLGSRFILSATLYKNTAVTSGDVMAVLVSLFEERGTPKIFHSDQGPAYVSRTFGQFLDDYGVAQSIDTKLFNKFDNQVAESVNSSLARYLEIQRSSKSGEDTFDFITGEKSKYYGINHMLRQNLRAQVNYVRAAVAHFNQLSKNTVESLSHEQLYDALANIALRDGLVSKSTDAKAQITKEFHRMVAAYTNSNNSLKQLEQTSGVSATLTTEIRSMFETAAMELESLAPEMQKLQGFTLFFKHLFDIVNTHLILAEGRQEKILLTTEDTNSEVKILSSQLDSVIAQNAALADKLAFVQGQTSELIEAKREKEEAALLRKAKAANRTTRLKRGFIKDVAFVQILKSVIGQTPLLVSRDRLALIILKLFAFRIGQLRTFTIGNLRDIFEGRKTEVILIKNDQQYPFEINPSDNQRQWLKCFEREFEIVNEAFPDNNMCPWGLSRSHFNRRINSYLKAYEVLKKLSIPIRSQSLRITSLTTAIKEVGLIAAKEIAGHKNLSTTLGYYRNQLTSKQQKAVYDAINPLPENLKASIDQTGEAHRAFYSPVTNLNSVTDSTDQLEITEQNQKALETELSQSDNDSVIETESLSDKLNAATADPQIDPLTKNVLSAVLALKNDAVQSLLDKLPDEESFDEASSEDENETNEIEALEEPEESFVQDKISDTNDEYEAKVRELLSLVDSTPILKTEIESKGLDDKDPNQKNKDNSS